MRRGAGYKRGGGCQNPSPYLTQKEKVSTVDTFRMRRWALERTARLPIECSREKVRIPHYASRRDEYAMNMRLGSLSDTRSMIIPHLFRTIRTKRPFPDNLDKSDKTYIFGHFGHFGQIDHSRTKRTFWTKQKRPALSGPAAGSVICLSRCSPRTHARRLGSQA